MKPLFTLIIFLAVQLNLFAQYPSYFSYNIENGAPSNEIYSIMQDRDGYIWIGCDAGVYRFNGVRYEQFTSPELTARSATGLVQTPNGRIYGYNFNSQLFYIENGNLKVLKDWGHSVNAITYDKSGFVWVSSPEGIFKIDESTMKFEPVYSKYHAYDPHGRTYTGSVRTDSTGTIYYHNYINIIQWKNGSDQCIRIGEEFKNLPLIVSESRSDPWLFDIINGHVYKKTVTGWSAYTNKSLLELLKGRKVNNIVEMSGGIFWISTHSGLIRFNKKTGSAEILYEDISFSNCIADREENLWFTTLHDGILRIPAFELRSWSAQTGAFKNETFSHIVSNGKDLFCASTTGELAELVNGGKVNKILLHDPKSDFGMLYFDPIDKCVYFNKVDRIYRYSSGTATLVNDHARALKSMIHVSSGYLLLSSQGLYFVKDLATPLNPVNMILEEWLRDVVLSGSTKNLYCASNGGLFELRQQNQSWKINRVYLKDKQIISLCEDKESNRIYCLTFDGSVVYLDTDGKLKHSMSLENGVRATQIRWDHGHIYLSTNKGLLIVDIATGKKTSFNLYNGLSSNNVRGVTFTKDHCWVATGKGIQRVPLSLIQKRVTKGRLILREFLVNNEGVSTNRLIKINNNDVVTILADGLSYRSNGAFQFAYRLNGYNDKWITVPGSAGKIIIPQLPPGRIDLEVKLIDHAGFDSENTLHFQLDVLPPFWGRWWFYLLIVLTVGVLVYLIFQRRESILRKKQQQELRQIHLENELRLTQQNALKAQMNPHFLFNVLNSIKGYIYENDKKNAAKYLSDFSSLVRKVLELSSVPTVPLDRELEALKLYIDLEAMLLQNDFSYSIEVDQNVDESGIKIPALLIQPYVENAFKHGLRHKIGEKELHIVIRYEEADEYLLISIIDNGIGRQAAEQINKTARAEHQSFATNAMEHRLKLLNHEKQGLVGVEIVDNLDALGNSVGTTVNIRIHV
jgi:ligand-binding sensor domain-containing protein